MPLIIKYSFRVKWKRKASSVGSSFMCIWREFALTIRVVRRPADLTNWIIQFCASLFYISLMINSKAAIRVNYGDDAKNERSEKIELKFIWTGNFESTGSGTIWNAFAMSREAMRNVQDRKCKLDNEWWWREPEDFLDYCTLSCDLFDTEKRSLIHAADTEPGSSLLEIE